jgi:hypothetical protein
MTDDERRRLRHDLRAPLTISDENRRDYAQRILNAAKELRVMLDELLEP